MALTLRTVFEAAARRDASFAKSPGGVVQNRLSGLDMQLYRTPRLGPPSPLTDSIRNTDPMQWFTDAPASGTRDARFSDGAWGLVQRPRVDLLGWQRARSATPSLATARSAPRGRWS